MFKDRANDALALAGGGNFPAAYLSRSQIVESPSTGSVRDRAGSLGQSLREWRDTLSAKWEGLDLCADLAQDIGSKRWLRGTATFIGLATLALSGWPEFAPLKAAPATFIDAATRDEFRSQMIMPLALGGESGRRMGATALVTALRDAPERPRLNLEAVLAPGDTIGNVLLRSGASNAEAGLINAMVAAQVPMAQIAPGTQIDLTLGRRSAPGTPRPVESLSFRARFDLQLAVERRDGRLSLSTRPIPVDETPLRIRGVIGSSLYRSARAAGAPAAAVQQYLRTVGAEVDLDSGLTPGDQFDLVVEYKRAATGEAEVGRLLYAGIANSVGKPLKQLLRWGSTGRFFEASGVGEVQSGLLAPVVGRITSTFGMRRHPLLGYTRLHAGIDFGAAYGAPIFAVTDGTVQYAGWHGGHGNFVKLDHGGGLGTGYGHMSRIAVSPGMHVRQGQVIGYVGSTGLSTGPHLHYEVYRNGAPVNPAYQQFATRSELDGPELAAFRARLKALQQLAPGAALSPVRTPLTDRGRGASQAGRFESAETHG